ncbi:polysaccharide biosynthesis protein [Pollutimonas thiosulfatoxidans]|uniref:Polysaccharide biosynthesis protein n=1 Tax=Pollutimonas thiosulfatoxidans TaxID=2028345 RepID=A0A410GEH9_9BURK|nr:nucleoside-diphosphate sugar epimerase/dehydratase [Pollutimonas thiosulfatoxidans]QAA94702.1 polysaccharide biosynthesis protein [Pollutimonas thiosulfatoxidans]
MDRRSTLRSWFAILFDLAAVPVAWIGAFLIRFNFAWPFGYEKEIWIGLALLMAIHSFVRRWAGLHRGMWIFAGVSDLRRVVVAVSISTAVLLLFVVLARHQLEVPRSVVLLYPILLVLLMGGGRIAWRIWSEYLLYGKRHPNALPVIVVGAGTAGAMLVRELDRSADWQVVALVDDDRGKWGLELSGRRVEGGTDMLPSILERYGVKHVILAMPSAKAESLQRVSVVAAQAGANLFTVPGLGELMSGRVAINVMRPVKVEDLLGRKSVRIDSGDVETMLSGKYVLVTGAGGSIGSELCRQLARFSPAAIILLEASEFALYMVEQWFGEHRPEIDVIALAGDVKDDSCMQQIFRTYKPAIVFHAAAYKHVPLMEVRNAWQAVRNNAKGTLVVANCAKQYGSERFVLISTDKAVNPTNVMGASKRLAEMICEVLHCTGGATRFQMVRFGNVLGSTGSVIPKFRSQIAQGGPVTVTHPEITRFFMSIPEAAQLVLQAAAMGKGGEVFVLDMGEPVKIVDLARNMIRLSGFTEQEIPIQFTGLRPGEKLFEELLADSEETLPTPHEKLRIARSRPVPEGFFVDISEWLQHSQPVTDSQVRAKLKEWIPEYQPRCFESEVSEDTIV